MLYDICYEVDLEYDIIIDSKIISLNELNHSIIGTHPLYNDAITEGIHA